MTLYMLFGVLGTLYTGGAAYFETVLSSRSAQVGTLASNSSSAAAVAAVSPRAQAAGKQLFDELGCIGCHRPDSTGIGPVLKGLFGRPVTDASCGALIVD